MEEVSEERSICESFLDDPWPLVLGPNRCDTRSTDFKPYFVPERKFDHLWAHEFLASKCCSKYQPAIEINCCELLKDEENLQKPDDEEIEQLPYRDPYIIPLDKQLENLQRDCEVRHKLANDFVNRTYPWYIQRPSYECSFKITDEMKALFTNPFEYQLLEKIQYFDCNLMLIDVGPDVPLKNLGWVQKFAPYVAIVCTVHDVLMCRELNNFNRIFNAVYMVEEEESTWHDSLNNAIELGLKFAKKLYFYDDISKAFAFVFSNNRGICVFDKFKILRKS